MYQNINYEIAEYFLCLANRISIIQKIIILERKRTSIKKLKLYVGVFSFFLCVIFSVSIFFLALSRMS